MGEDLEEAIKSINQFIEELGIAEEDIENEDSYMGEDLEEAIESLHKEMEETLGIKYEDIDEYLDKYVDEDSQ